MTKSGIIITGCAGELGKLLTRYLHQGEKVIGIDRRPFPNKPRDVEFYQLDIRRKKCENIFRTTPIKAVFHMGVIHNPRSRSEEKFSFNIKGTMKLLEYCSKYQVPKFVFLSSANVYGPAPANDNFITEEAPLMAGASFHDIGDLIELDMLVQSFFWKNLYMDTCILRPVHIVGSSIENALTIYLRLPAIPSLLGFDPLLQLIHEDDVIRALALCLKKGVKGVFNLVGAGEAPLSAIISHLNKVNIPIPYPLAVSLLRMMWRWKLTSFPVPELDHIRYGCTVDGNRAKTILDFHPRYSMSETLKSITSINWSKG